MSLQSPQEAADAQVSTMSITTTSHRIPPMTATFQPLIPALVEREKFPAPKPLIADERATEVSGSTVDSEEAGPCTTFTCFSKLSAELRLRIWKLMLPESRVVPSTIAPTSRWYDSYERIPNGFWYSRSSKRLLTIPITLHVCAESRHETLNIYTAVGRQYIDFNRDTFWLTSKTFRFFDDAFPVGGIPWVKSLLVETHPAAGRWGICDPTRMSIDYGRMMEKFPNLTDLSARTWYVTKNGQEDTLVRFANPNPRLCVGEGEDKELAEAKLLRWKEEQKTDPLWTQGELREGDFQRD